MTLNDLAIETYKDKLLSYERCCDYRDEVRKMNALEFVIKYPDIVTQLHETVRDDEGDTALHLVCGQPHCDDMFNIIKHLIKYGVNVNTHGYNGNTPLMVAHNEDVIKLLIENGADVNARNNDGKTPIMFLNSADTTKLLVDNGADINAQDNYGSTALQRSCEMRGYKNILALIEYGADITKPIIIQNIQPPQNRSEEDTKEDTTYVKKVEYIETVTFLKYLLLRRFPPVYLIRFVDGGEFRRDIVPHQWDVDNYNMFEKCFKLALVNNCVEPSCLELCFRYVTNYNHILLVKLLLYAIMYV